MRTTVLSVMLLLLIGTLAGAMMVKVEIPELVANSTNIITGKVLSVTSYYTPDHKSIYTVIDIAVQSEIAGSTNSSEIAIRQAGGIMPDLGLAIEDMPVFNTGEAVILFLAPNGDGTFKVGDMRQGKYTIANDTIVENGEPVSQFMAEISSASLGVR
jgi:hypothetical protein